MEPVRPVAAPSPNAGIEAPQRSFSPSSENGDRRELDPAVTVELSPAAAKREAASESRAFVRDDDSQKVVFRITDTASGDVIVQIPNEIIIKARAYGRQPEPSTGGRVVRSV